MSCVIDKADNLKVIESDSHFSDFVGVHPSKIKQGKLFFRDILNPQDREAVIKNIGKKDSPYVYMDFYIKNKKGEYIFVHCTANNIENSTECRMTLADVSNQAKKSELFKTRAEEMNRLIDFVSAGVCMFRVDSDMHFEALYMNEACCSYFATAKDIYKNRKYHLDELIYPEDKSAVFQAVGRAMATKMPIDTELRILPHKNSYMWCRMNAAIHRYDDDGCPVFHATFFDITKYVDK